VYCGKIELDHQAFQKQKQHFACSVDLHHQCILTKHQPTLVYGAAIAFSLGIFADSKKFIPHHPKLPEPKPVE
jgi:hypothetical protein